MVDAAKTLPSVTTGGLATVAVRVPDHALLRRFLAELRTPLTATSANRAGEAPLLEPSAVAELLELLERGEPDLGLVVLEQF